MPFELIGKGMLTGLIFGVPAVAIINLATVLSFFVAFKTVGLIGKYSVAEGLQILEEDRINIYFGAVPRRSCRCEHGTYDCHEKCGRSNKPAAIGFVPLSLGLPCGNLVLSVAVLAILITTPLGAIGMDIGYKWLLKQDE